MDFRNKKHLDASGITQTKQRLGVKFNIGCLVRRNSQRNTGTVWSDEWKKVSLGRMKQVCA